MWKTLKRENLYFNFKLLQKNLCCQELMCNLIYCKCIQIGCQHTHTSKNAIILKNKQL